MARQICKLTALDIAQKRAPGYYSDGGGLYLQISPTGTKSWLFIYTIDGRSREMGLGSINDYSLKEARERATACRKLRSEGKDPIEERNAILREQQLARAMRKTFDECAHEYILGKQAEWKNPKHREQWINTIATYASPHIGLMCVSEIGMDDVLKVLKPIWMTKTNTATRLRGRIETVLNYAASRGYRQGENPARYQGHLDFSLAAPKRIAEVTHFPALAYAQIADFMHALAQQEGVSARALEFLILTACRTNDVIGATWPEVDFDEALLSIRTARMKGQRGKKKVEVIHRIPLSGRALDILRAMAEIKNGDYIFPGRGENKPLSNMALIAIIRRMNAGKNTAPWLDPHTGREVVPHGFRSTFKDWGAEVEEISDVLSEKALGHVVGDETRAAYQRGDMLLKRRRLMERWAAYCTKPNGKDNVIEIQRSSTAA